MSVKSIGECLMLAGRGQGFLSQARVLAKARHPTGDDVHTVINKGLPGNRMKDKCDSATLWESELLEVVFSICFKSHTGIGSLFCNPMRKDPVYK